ncbi:MAG: undecaprenyl-diphosphate phosphatase [Campylobacteraceae bacterium]|jgi:undecaprenyl-diphosphatase|nr:undecaprenyl-diphosphate phosphatase [Campylobacteraceae bacterium]
MSWFEVFMLSIIQGITEFLPVSSSAHLILAPRIFGWQDQGLAFDVATHFGTLFAVIIYFRNEILMLLKDWLYSLKAHKNIGESTLAWGIIIATIPACIAGLLFNELIETYLRSPRVIASTTIIFGVVLFAADRFSGKKNEKNITLYIALLIGLAQVLSLIPGVSRSGITLSAALLLGFSRVSAARFSFLLSIPIILLASGYEGLKLVQSAFDVQWDKIIGAIVISFLSGYACIHLFLKAISRFSITPFVIYRLLLGAVLFYLFWSA